MFCFLFGLVLNFCANNFLMGNMGFVPLKSQDRELIIEAFGREPLWTSAPPMRGYLCSSNDTLGSWDSFH